MLSTKNTALITSNRTAQKAFSLFAANLGEIHVNPLTVPRSNHVIGSNLCFVDNWDQRATGKRRGFNATDTFKHGVSLMLSVVQ
jgi:hypothetical protein